MHAKNFEILLTFDDSNLANQLFGSHNQRMELLAKESGVYISTRGASVTIKGIEQTVTIIENLLTQLYAFLKSNGILRSDDLVQGFHLLSQNPHTNLKESFQKTTFVISPRRTIVPKTLNQRIYVEALNTAPITFGVGPAGTGKTYLAVAMALSMLISKKVKRIILTRPAVEAGEKLGFLPGDMAQKVNPYLRPLFDALHDMLDYERVQEMIESGVIEIAPLAFMRGRTLNSAFIILDEAQNTTAEQMKMFITRLGFGSHMAITGDATQVDLPNTNGKVRSGLLHAMEILKNINEIRLVHFVDKDVIRHPLVGQIVQAYDSFETHS